MRFSLAVLAVGLLVTCRAAAQERVKVLSDDEVLHGIRSLSVLTNVVDSTVENYVNLYNLRAGIESRLRQFRINAVGVSDYRLRLNILLDKARGGAYYVVRLEVIRPALVRTGTGADTYADTRLIVYDDARFGTAGNSSIGESIIDASNNLVTEFLAKHALANSSYNGAPLVQSKVVGDNIPGLKGTKDIGYVLASVERGFEGSITSSSAEDWPKRSWITPDC